jgi:agarase
MRQPAGGFARGAGLAMLRTRHPSFDAFSAVWPSAARTWADLEHAEGDLFASTIPPDGSAGAAITDAPAFRADCDAFVEALARRYFRATVAAVKAADPEHLSLGCRFATVPRPVVLAEAAVHLDIISLNCYDSDPTPVLTAYAATGKPFLIGEFSFRGDDAGLPNSRGGGPRVPTQRDRARSFGSYVTSALRQPGLVGCHWFEHADQPAEGRFDGEDCNYGIVTITDGDYPDMTRAMSALNAQAEMIHSGEALVASVSPSDQETAQGPSPLV